MERNAKTIWDYLTSRGWTQEAVAGLLGNIEIESGIEPNIHEISGGGGYGLVQWTPASNLINWAHNNGMDPANIYTQLKRLEYEVENCHNPAINPFLDKLNRGMTFKDYIKLREKPEEMAKIFVINYERPSAAGMKLEKRQAAAKRWYSKFKAPSGHTPIPTPPNGAGVQYYTVQAGDSYWGISRKFGLTIDELLEMNNISINHVIHPGDRLIIKKGNGHSDPIPNPESGGSSEKLVTSYVESGQFTANQTLNIHNHYFKTSTVAATLYAGESVYYDSVYITDKYVWISYISYSGVRRYVAIRTYNNGIKGPVYGTIR